MATPLAPVVDAPPDLDSTPIRLDVARRGARSPSRSRPPSRGRAAPPKAARRPRASPSPPRTRRDRPATVAPSNAKPVPAPGWRRLVDDGVGEPARPVDDRRRPVAQRDHLALAARLEARRHHEEVGAGVDAPRHRPVEPLDERDLARVVRGDRPERLGDASGGRCPGRRAARPPPSSVGRGARQQVEPLLRVQPPDHPDDRARRRPGRTRAGVEQVRPADRLAGRVRREYGAARSGSVAGSQTVVSIPLRIPMNRSPRARSSASRPIPNSGVSASAAKPGETVLTSSARSIPLAAGGRPRRRRPATTAVARREPELPERRRARVQP